MRKLMLLCAALCAMAFAGAATPALAQATRTWVSGVGDDANPCSRTAPCKTFAGAIATKTAAGGEIDCLDPGEFGAVTITQSITIDCNSNVGTIASASTAITINASTAVTVVLRHLNLNGLGTAPNGITTVGFPSGSVTVENCTVQGYTGAGIGFTPSSGRGLLQVSNSQVINNGFGISVAPASGQIASVTLNGVEVAGNGNNGVSLAGPGVVAGTMRDSLVASNAVDGVQSTASQVFFTVEESSIIANLSSGIHTTSAGSNLNVTASTVSANGTGIKATSGSIVSFGNNTLNGNGSDGAFTSTASLK
jgi:hypothetical protein